MNSISVPGCDTKKKQFKGVKTYARHSKHPCCLSESSLKLSWVHRSMECVSKGLYFQPCWYRWNYFSVHYLNTFSRVLSKGLEKQYPSSHRFFCICMNSTNLYCVYSGLSGMYIYTFILSPVTLPETHILMPPPTSLHSPHYALNTHSWSLKQHMNTEKPCSLECRPRSAAMSAEVKRVHL